MHKKKIGIIYTEVLTDAIPGRQFLFVLTSLFFPIKIFFMTNKMRENVTYNKTNPKQFINKDRMDNIIHISRIHNYIFKQDNYGHRKNWVGIFSENCELSLNCADQHQQPFSTFKHIKMKTKYKILFLVIHTKI